MQKNNPRNAFGLVGFFFRKAILATLLGAMAAQAAVVSVSPEGEVRDARQIALRFDTDMAALGAMNARDPAVVRCQGETLLRPKGRWLDHRRWVAEFDEPLPTGVRCDIALAEGVKDHAGHPVPAAGPWQFTTGGPRLGESNLSPGRVVRENDVFLLKPDAPVDAASLKHATCAIDKGAPRPLVWLDLNAPEVKDAARRWFGDGDSDKWLKGWRAARCAASPLPNEAQVRFVWGKDIATPWGVASRADQVFDFTVRPAFKASLACTEIPVGGKGCDPRHHVIARYTADVTQDEAKKMTLASGGASLGLPAPPWGGSKQPHSEWRYEKPGDEGVQVTATLNGVPEDVDNRPLANAGDFPRRLAFGRLPPYLGFPNSDATLVWRAARPAQMRLAARHLERELTVRDRVLDGNAPDWAARAQRFWLGEDEGNTHASAITVQTAGGGAEFVAVPLAAPGLHRLTAESPAWAAYAKDQQMPQSREARANVTNLGVNVLGSRDGMTLLWVTAIDSGLPVAGAEAVIFDCAGKPVWQGQTDADGLARFADVSAMGTCNDYRQQAFAVVRHGADLAVQPNVWDGGGPRPQWIGHTVLDRSLFQPGETVSVQFLLRRLTAQGFAPGVRQGRAAVYFNDRDKIADWPLTFDAAGRADAQWKIPADAKQGRYHVRVEIIDSQTGEANWVQSAFDDSEFSVIEFRLPTLDAKLGGTPQWPEKGKNGQILPIKASLRYLAGGAAAGAPVTLQGRYKSSITPPVADWHFTDDSLPAFGKQNMPSAAFKLDQEGAATHRLAVPAFGRPVHLQAEMKFADANGETQTVHQDYTLWPGAVKVGLQVEALASGRKLAAEALALDARDQPLAGQSIRFTLEPGKRETPFTATGLRVTHCVGKTNAQGRLACAIAVPEGEPDIWLVRAESADRAGRATVAGKALPRWQLRWADPNDKQEKPLALLTPEPAPGTEAEFLVKPPFLPATLLLTATREGVQAAKVLRLTQAESRVRLPVTAAFAPRVHVTARFVRGEDEMAPPQENAAPSVAGERLAISPPQPQPGGGDALWADHNLVMPIDPAARKLAVSVKPDAATVRPGGRLMVELAAKRARDGSPAAHGHITLAVVDEALLALKANESWQRHAAMMRNTGEGITARNSRQSLLRNTQFGPRPEFSAHDEWGNPTQDLPLSAYGVADERLAMAAPSARTDSSAAQNRGDESGPTANLRRNFSSLALWQADVALDAAGRARVTVPFPDNLTRWRVVAIADDVDHFGEGSAQVTAASDVQLLSGLPPVVRSGDRLVQTATLRNTGEKPLRLEFTASATAHDDDRAQDLPPYRQTLTLAPGQSHVLRWPLTVPPATAIDWRLQARGLPEKAGKAEKSGVGDALALTQRVFPAAPVTVRQASLEQLAPQAELPVTPPGDALPGSARVEIGLAASLTRAALTGVAQWMRQYPHTCLEQQSSRAIALNDKALWDTLMADLPKYLDNQGRARFFPSDRLPGSESLTAYLLKLSAQSGWEIPAVTRERMLNALATALAQANSEEGVNADGRLPYQLTLQAALAAFRPLEKPLRPADPGALPAQALADWGQALLRQPLSPQRSADLQEISRQLRNRYEAAGTRLQWRDEAREFIPWRMGGGDLAAAETALWALAARHGDAAWTPEIPLLVRGLVGRQQRGAWSTTTANAWGTLALRRFAADFEKSAVSGETRLQINQAETGYRWPATSASAPYTGEKPATASDAKTPEESAKPAAPALKAPLNAAAPLLLTHHGSGQPWANIAVLAAVPLKAPLAAGIAVTKTVTPVEQRTPGRWSVGDIVRVTLKMKADAGQTWVALKDPAPSGASLLGRGTARESTLAERKHNDLLSYEELTQESYRAYYRRVPRGDFQAEYLMRINNAGRFSLPPTRVEAMYAPEVFGETPNADVEVAP